MRGTSEASANAAKTVGHHVVLSGLNVNVTQQHRLTCVASSLHDICVQGHIANAIYPKVWIRINIYICAATFADVCV